MALAADCMLPHPEICSRNPIPFDSEQFTAVTRCCVSSYRDGRDLLAPDSWFLTPQFAHRRYRSTVLFPVYVCEYYSGREIGEHSIQQRRDRALFPASHHARGNPRGSETTKGRLHFMYRFWRTRLSNRSLFGGSRNWKNGIGRSGRCRFLQYLVIDGTDNFPTRYLSNDVCVLTKKPNIYGSIFRFDGQCTVFAPHLGGPCYRCMFPEPPPPGMVPSCAEGGVLGVLPGMIGVMQAIEAVKLILGTGEPLIGRLISFDALKMRFREFKVRRDPNCPICGDNPTIHELIDYEQFCGLPQADAEAEKELAVPGITVLDLKAKIERKDPFVLVDVREPYEYEICSIPGSHLIPLGELPSRLSELDSADEIVLQCKGGTRSARALHILQEAGFRKLYNLEGGITAWAEQVDPTVPKY